MKMTSSRRHIVLLEVLIAFALVALCALPLIYPHVQILKSEKAFVTSIELDHLVNLLFSNRLQKLYQNEISWSDIVGERELSIDERMIHESGFQGSLPFTGTYKFIEVKHKSSDVSGRSVYLFNLNFRFTPKKENSKKIEPKVLSYDYQIVLERRVK